MDEFTAAYIKAALWSTCDNDDNPLDDKYGPEHISPELLVQIEADCEKFQAEHGHLWANASGGWATRRAVLVAEQAGHDFWLTRNGHGAGFWDKPEIYGDDNAQKLTEACKAFGEVYLYVGDDGKIHT